MNNTASNVTPIESKQPAPSGARFTITASIDGFPVSVEVEGKADVLRAMIDRLKAIGAEPPSAPQNLQNPEPTKAAGVPVCPVHGTKMKPSRKPGSFFCPRQAEDGSGYCPEKA
jgi:hypothetical protein